MKAAQNSGIFRSVDFWKSAVMTMPDNSFFELMRSVFGKIKTPFNKQQLLNDLEKFLLREDIQKTIAAYIDENDAKVISAVALFGEPAPEDLGSFFAGELSFMQLQDIIVNLEERFILYRSNARLALNPVLGKVLAGFTKDTSALFPAITEAEANLTAKNSKAAVTQTVINDRILAALFSFVSQWQVIYRAEGFLRKQIVDAGKTVFPGIDLEEMLGSLQVLGLFYTDGEKLLIDTKHLSYFTPLPERERMEYCAAAISVYSEMKPQIEILFPLYKNKIRETVNLIHGFLDALDTNFLYTEITLKKMMEVLKVKTGAEAAAVNFFVLEKTGLIENASREYKRLGSVVQKSQAAKRNDPSIAIDSSSILVYPEIDFADAVNLSAFLNIKETGAVVRFELEKDSAVRAFDNGITAQKIIDALNRLFGKSINETLVWNVKDWEKRYGEVSLKKGLVLKLSQEHRYLAQTKPLADKIEETLAPGVYLLNENTMEDTAAVLRNAGIDIISRRVGNKLGKKETAPHEYTGYYPSPSLQTLLSATALKSKNTAEANNCAAKLKNNFHTILEKMPLDKAERDELSARIDRRLVLCEAQLKEASIRYEKLEARHMDYTGKQNIAKQAIAQGSPVEIVWQNGKQIYGTPKALEKDGSELIFVVTLEKEELRIPLAKISLLRRIKKSIFEG